MSELEPRVMGSEIEYGFTTSTDIEKVSEPKFPRSIIHYDSYLANGGRLYVDLGMPEYSTPECTSLDELVAHELAGEQLVYKVYGKAPGVQSIHKRAASALGKEGTGSHENYATTVDLWHGEKRDYTIRVLATHFATRSIFTGAGLISHRGFFIAQKVHHAHNESGRETTTTKALVNTRNEPETREDYNRLHVVCGDANVSPWAIRMKFGTTSLVLRLLESGSDLSDLLLAKPVRDAHVVGRSPANMVKPLPLKNGMHVSAIDVQEALAMRVLKLSRFVELASEEQDVLHDWLEIINSLRHYTKTGETGVLMDQIDWFAKQQLMQKYADTKGKVTHAQLAALDLLYDRLPEGAGMRMRQTSPYLPPADFIEEATEEPPRGRAQRRGALVLALNARKSQQRYRVGWDGLRDTSLKKLFDFGLLHSEYTKQEVSEWLEEKISR